MPRALTYALALLLGVGAAVLAACSGGTRGGIPAADASDLKSQLEDVRQRVADGNCDELAGQLRQVDDAVDNLPRSVDARLVRSLSDGANRLRRAAVEECNVNSAPTQTDTEPTETETQTETPPETTTAETTRRETTTAPPRTSTATYPPSATAPPPPPPEPPPAPPPGSPEGGTPPGTP